MVDAIRAAVDRLSHSTSFLTYLGKHALIIHEELPTPNEENVDDQRYDFMSLLLNLVNTFLYMVNTYIIVPTADDYSMSLGAAATVCGVVIGAMAVAQIFSSVYFSAWSNKSYFKPLVFSSIVLFVGNVMYALAYDFDSITVLLLGRLFCGYVFYPCSGCFENKNGDFLRSNMVFEFMTHHILFTNLNLKLHYLCACYVI